MNAPVNPSNVSEQKVCCKCRALKPIEEFNFRNRSAGVRHHYCRDCGKDLTRSHYQRNKRQYCDRSLRAKLARREHVRQMKSRPCADCGIQYPYYVMDFDHREGEEKVFEMNRVIYVTMGALKKEIEKCDVVCSNCHRERTYRRVMEKTRDRRRH
jgi:hypothetical protein